MDINMSETVEEYVAKIGRITSEYKQLSRKEVEFNDDGESSLEEIKERKINIYKYIKKKALKCEDIRIAIAVLEYTPKMFKYLPPQFKHDKQFFLDVMPIIESARILKFADDIIRNDFDCCVEALRIDYTVYPYISDKLQNNPKIIDVYEWGREMSEIPKTLADIDLSQFGPDEDDKYFQSLPIKAKIVLGKEIPIDEEDYIPPSKPISQKHKEMKTPLKADNEFNEDATLDWGTDNFDDDDDLPINEKKASDNDPELPPKKDLKKKGFISKIIGS